MPENTQHEYATQYRWIKSDFKSSIITPKITLSSTTSRVHESPVNM